ncbi:MULTISPECIES: ribonuclease T2 [Sinorhizobium]|uniref:Ribonuclease n=1 Tax=Sinorhizobium americanum TaxID=194963 RepID=A0A2S3YMR6_9HYPH|nr:MULTISPECIES: ribonuclease [Sinorhizobium]ASY57207.1 macromolecule metabolism [Sinorhizobium sp. CCBAU 05631]PDT42443.1 ribonuclease [Sinorhizobium sp. FG01]PDT54520.1 ribonuclease [Sinorhizobium sp. NG07B]POH30363.1 ribonuclease [Sinorhizobium americanum]POH31571.1 ribonuclease [Sinorhizobium americanum]
MAVRAIVQVVRVAALALGLGMSSLAAAEESPGEEMKTVPDGARTEYVLAVSWQPGFCETRPTRKECVDQTSDRFDATHFSLHGLWPLKKSYCGVETELKAQDRKGEWLELPKLAMADETAARLIVAMPGVKSGLDRHQWLRSGTCQADNADDYFTLQLRLLDELNASAVRALFADRIGSEIGEKQIKAAFEQSFGAGAGDRVRMRCQTVEGRSVITGLTIGLSGDLSGQAGLAGLIKAAGPTEFKCAKGIADAAGRG